MDDDERGKKRKSGELHLDASVNGRKVRRETRRETQMDQDYNPDNRESPESTKLIPQHHVIKMELQDFMCHANLRLDFHPRVNFIVGQNGSGKSACLTAMTFVFGGTARDTGKKGTVAQYVRTGKMGVCRKAIAKVTVSNEGPFPYKPNEFYKEITFERTISHTGVSTYRMHGVDIKGKRTKEDCKAGDIKAIAEHFNIQVTNPINIMSQDHSKGFLRQGPRSHYDFFMQGTMLTAIEKKYEQLADHLEVLQRTLKDQKTKAESSEHRQVKVEQRLKKIKMVEMAETSIKEQTNHKLWAIIPGKEKEIKKVIQRLDHATKILEEDQSKYGQSQGRLEDLEQQTQGSQGDDERKRLQVEKTDILRQIDAVEKEVRDVQSAIKDLKREFTRLERDQLEHEQDVKEYKKGLETCRDDATKKKIEQQEKERDDIDAQKQEIVKERDRNRTKIDQTKDKLEEMKMQRSHFINQANEEKRRVMACNRDITQLQERMKNKQITFGKWVPEVTYMIKKQGEQGGWNVAPPIGPIGDYISVLPLHQKYTGLIEYLVGSYLKAYIVFDDEDKKRLERILNRLITNPRDRPKVMRCRMNTDPIDENPTFQRQLMKHPRYPTIYSAISVKEPMVVRTLVEWAGIHRLLMMPDLDVAVNEIQEEVNNPGLKTYPIAYVTDGSVVRTRRATTGKAHMEGRFLTRDVSHVIRAKEIDRNKANQNQEKWLKSHEQSNEEYRALQNVLTKATSDDKTWMRKENELDKASHEINLKLRAIRNENMSVDENFLTTQMNDALAKIDEIKEKTEKVREKEVEREAERKQKHAALKDLETKNRNVLKEIEELNNSRKNAENTKKKLMAECARRNEAVQVKKQERDEIDKQLADLNRQLRKALDAAEAVMERPEKILQLHEIEESIKSYQDQVRNAVIEPGEFKKLTDKLSELVNEHVKMEEDITVLKRTVSKAKRQINVRLSGFEALKIHMSNRVEEFFVIVCDLVDYMGRIEINHHAKEIRLFVVKYAGKSKEAARQAIEDLVTKGQKGNVGSLSGGERSISTVMFLISLWKTSLSPIRCIDEYDVFMDTHHKQLATQLLCSYAKNDPTAQLCFLTPTGLADSLPNLKRVHGDIFKVTPMPTAERPTDI